MSVPTDVATVLLQQHVDNVLLHQQQQAQAQVNIIVVLVVQLETFVIRTKSSLNPCNLLRNFNFDCTYRLAQDLWPPISLFQLDFFFKKVLWFFSRILSIANYGGCTQSRYIVFNFRFSNGTSHFSFQIVLGASQPLKTLGLWYKYINQMVVFFYC